MSIQQSPGERIIAFAKEHCLPGHDWKTDGATIYKSFHFGYVLVKVDGPPQVVVRIEPGSFVPRTPILRSLGYDAAETASRVLGLHIYEGWPERVQ